MISEVTHQSISYINSLSSSIPLPVFAFLGSIIEEIIAPIPSPLIMTLAGTMAASLGKTWPYLVLLSLTGAVGKTIASYFIYLVADKFEDVVLVKFGKFIGLTHAQVEGIGQHLNKGIRDDIVLTLLRALPIIPSAPISAICGLIKLNLRTYLTSTLIGTFIRNFVYLIAGYTGLNAAEEFIVSMESLEVVVYLFVAIITIASISYFYYQKHKDAILHKFFNNNQSDSKTNL